MKKSGFTLAEVLVTLGIIGVVAALTLPVLNTNVQKQKVGPALRKFISTMENANEHILNDNDTTKLSSAVSAYTGNEIINNAEYLNEFVKYVNGSMNTDINGESRTLADYTGKLAPKPYGGSYNGPGEKSGDAAQYSVFNFSGGDSFAIKIPANYSGTTTTERVASYKGAAAEVWYDLNGLDTPPNKAGIDMFYFVIDENGSVVPFGGKASYAAGYTPNDDLYKNGDDPCLTKKQGSDGMACSGSVADNGWKVVYEY